VSTRSAWLDAIGEELLAKDSLSFIPDRDLPPPPRETASLGSGPRIAFVGFPSEFSLVFLLQLLQLDVELVGIVTSPGAHPAILGENALSRIAEHTRVPLIRAWRVNDEHTRLDLTRLGADASVMASFDQIVHGRTLAIPRHGFLNVHPSKLPAYRGPEPVYWAIAEGAAETGVSLHRAVAKVDAGPILAQVTAPIQAADTAGTLTRRLAEVGARELDTALQRLLADAPGSPPNLDRGSYRPSVGHRRLDDAPSAAAAERMVRAGVPNMPAWTAIEGQPLYVLGAAIGSGSPALKFADGDLTLVETSPTCRCHHDVPDCPHRE